MKCKYCPNEITFLENFFLFGKCPACRNHFYRAGYEKYEKELEIRRKISDKYWKKQK